MSEVVVVAFEVIEVEHHDRKGTVFPASRVEFAVEEFLHVAAIVKTGKRVADGLEAERFPEAETGNRESDVFGDSGGELAAADEGVRVNLRVGNGMGWIVVLDGQCSDGVAVGDERDADRRTFPQQM